MKAFYTPEHIAPILEEIRNEWKPETAPEVLAALNCEALLNRKRSRDYMAIRTPEKGGFYYTGKAARHLLRELAAWTEAAETEPGELDGWMYAEERRIMEAVRAALIEEYGRKASR